MGVENKVPAIRFTEFSGEWEDKTLGDYSQFRRGSFPQPYGNKQWYDGIGALPFVQVVDVRDKLCLVNDTKQKISVVAQPKSVFVEKGKVLVTLQGSIGRVAITQYDAYVDRTLLIFESFKNKTDSQYWAYVIQKKFELEKKKAPGAIIKTITKEALSSFLIRVPRYKEQKKIGAFFQQLDRLITQHQQKHDKLKNVKKALLEKMFPQQGERLPAIRFNGFSDEWEEKVLGELADIVRGASPRPIEDPKWFDDKSNIGWLRIKDVSEQDGRIYYLAQRISKEGAKRTRVLTMPHLLLSIAASVGKPVINYVNTGVHDGFLIFLKPIFIQEFMFQWLKGVEQQWQKYGQPGSQVNLNSDIVKNQNLSIPKDTKEQEKIGALFQQLDTLINQHQTQLTKLNNIKQACLAKMFV